MKRHLPILVLLLAARGVTPSTWAGVTVTFENPSQYTDFSLNDSKTEGVQKHLTSELEKHFQTLSQSYLPMSQTLEITVHDIDMAGEYEPWRAPSLTHTRIIRDIYRPRIDVSYVLRNEHGETLKQAREAVSDPNYLMKLDAAAYSPNDTLRYEKAMIRTWFQKTTRHHELLSSEIQECCD